MHLSLVLGLGGIGVGRNLGNNISSLKGALGVVSNIGVVLLGLHASSLDDVLVGVVRPATVATLVDGVAINNLTKDKISTNVRIDQGEKIPAEGRGRSGCFQQ